MKKARLASIFYVLIVIVLAYKLLESIINGYEKESWHITEFLINYQGGFVRRGLLGEVIYHISQYTTFSPYYIIITLSLAAYLYLVYFFMRAFVKNGFSIFLLPFVFLLGNPIINNFWVRKDVIQILLFLLALHLATKEGKRFIFYTNTILVIGILIHESIAFFGLPVLVLIFFHKHRKSTPSQSPSAYISFLIALTQLLPAIIAFASVIYFKGSPEIASSIWESWKDIKFPIEQAADATPPAAIDGISWTLAKGLSFLFITLKNFEFDIYAPFAWMLIITLIYFILVNINQFNFTLYKYKPTVEINRLYLSSILIIQLIAVTPLFILGWDYGRWVFLWTSSAFAILIMVPKQTISELLPPVVIASATYVNKQLNDYLSNSKAFLVLLSLVIGVPSYNWGIIKYIETVAPILILQFISEVFYEGVVLVKGILGVS